MPAQQVAKSWRDKPRSPKRHHHDDQPAKPERFTQLAAVQCRRQRDGAVRAAVSTSIALNRVIGSEASQIFGRLNANGQVFLINPNGVLFGQGAQVDVGGLVASTLNISDTDFLAGRYKFQSSLAPASILNQGTITAAAGGSVALLGGDVTNQGTISAHLGTVALAAGSVISLDFTGRQLMNVQVDATMLGALVDNQQLIQADGGLVIMTAAARDALLPTVVNNSGVIEARTVQNQGGVIKLLGIFEDGVVDVSGTLDASAPDGGNGGVITLAAAGNVNINDGAQIIGGAVTLRADSAGTCVAGASECSTVNFFGTGHITAADVALYYNPTGSNAAADASGIGPSYATPTDYSANVTGTLNAYMLVNDVNQLQAINTNRSGLYALGRDINASATSGWNGGAGFNPLGDLSTGFTGVFDGLDHTIYNLTINRPGTDYVGLFGRILGSTIRSVGLIGGSIAGRNYVGALIGHNAGYNLGGTVSNVSTSAQVSGVENVGGLVGYNSGAIAHAFATGTVSGTNSVGGLAGINDNFMTDVHSMGAVSGSFFVGGLVGESYGTIDTASSAGSVSGSAVVGGLAGLNTGFVNNGHYNADQVTINGGHHVTLGALYDSQYRDWVNHGLTLDIANYASLAFDSSSGAYLISSVRGLQDLLGFSTEGSYTFRLTADLDLAAVPGLYIPDFRAALFDGASHTIANLAIDMPFAFEVGMFGYVGSTSAVTHLRLSGATVTGDFLVGALAGFNDGLITHSSAMASVTGLSATGGLIGLNFGNVTDVHASGSVTGGAETGGLIGIHNGTLDDAYATGSVIGNENTGGLIGWSSGSVTRTYATGQVTGTATTGGLVGTNSGNVNNSYWDIQTTGQSQSAAGTGLTTAQFMSSANFAGFDFANTWFMIEGETRPFLRSEYSTTIHDAHQLQLMAMDMTASYVLANDIDMSELTQASGLWKTGAGFVPIGNFYSPFEGNFDGAGHTIAGLIINRPDAYPVASFCFDLHRYHDCQRRFDRRLGDGGGVGRFAGWHQWRADIQRLLNRRS
jgi:filamentous hemagglutinin family protein